MVAFLDLAPELRNRIYDELWSIVSMHAPAESPANEDALLKTCRTIRQEASHLFYTRAHLYHGLNDGISYNRMGTRRALHWLNWLGRRGDDLPSSLRKVTFGIRHQECRKTIVPTGIISPGGVLMERGYHELHLDVSAAPPKVTFWTRHRADARIECERIPDAIKYIINQKGNPRDGGQTSLTAEAWADIVKHLDSLQRDD